MPILPAEPDMYPADLWQSARTDIHPGYRWFCLHTKARHEKATARDLRSRKIIHYLPQAIQESRTPGGRIIRSVIPLFSGYLFLFGDDPQRVEALRSNNLANVLEVADQQSLDRDLRQIHQMLSSGLPVIPEPTHPVGAKVKILSGPLVGLIGTVVRRGQRDQFVAVVRFLGRGATVELQDWQVERIED
jgi:transcription antitermination factor NusG